MLATLSCCCCCCWWWWSVFSSSTDALVMLDAVQSDDTQHDAVSADTVAHINTSHHCHHHNHHQRCHCNICEILDKEVKPEASRIIFLAHSFYWTYIWNDKICSWSLLDTEISSLKQTRSRWCVSPYISWNNETDKLDIEQLGVVAIWRPPCMPCESCRKCVWIKSSLNFGGM